MRLLTCMAFGAGLAAFIYGRFGRRLGYGNTKNIAIVIGVVFVISTVFFYTIMLTLNIHN